MTELALVTGASSGIGRALATYHAAQGGDVVLVARREDSLRSLADDLQAAHGITAHVMAADLTRPGAVQDLVARLDQSGLEVGILINNAGFGGRGIHVERALEDELEMIDLNVKALVSLSHAIGGRMARRGGGRILNVGSTAGFMPGPQQAIYFATKAFVNSFSQALDHELREDGVTSTVLVPGYVETEFAERSDLTGTPLTKGGGMTAAEVAKIGHDAMMAGKLVAFDRTSLSLPIQWIFPFLPRRMVMSLMARMQSK
ncbi:SDR family NAD(P)-dependent oxidoreductase [Maribius pontilimi]|uniref:SDR family NAD(P)-dependent oxidoreductase n=1 Tax=Palleronia pontilimi TaxID=1964209 RepID=A0A934IBD6_9RHOB|nr:SDR family NAD(P)-dependent oxidoreductase [Palleronia pontilimi]MBJ3761362.1 SDR family NAD(P)-dependent oxidoreductase [Palleronia pontilimi]